MALEIIEGTGRIIVGSTPAVASGLNSNRLTQDQPSPPLPPPRHLAGFTDGKNNEMDIQLKDDKSHQSESVSAMDSSYVALQVFEDKILNLVGEEGVLDGTDFKTMSINPEEELSERMSNTYRKQ